MTVLHDIPRAAVNGWLRLARLPIDRAVDLLPDNGTGTKPAASITVDRADATVRDIAATVLRDPDLADDARRRRAAIAKREDALRLRIDAEKVEARADQRLDRREAAAEQQRDRAQRQARAEREQAQNTKARRTQAAAKAEQQRRQASRKAAARAEEAIDEREPHERLEALDAKAEALEQRADALTAADEARRLKQAAGRAKASRKRS